MTAATTDRPAALQGLKETPSPTTVPEQGSYCTFHGPQPGGNCAQCDEHYPDLVAARVIGSNAVAGAVGYTKAEVDSMVAAAVSAAMDEFRAFEKWKASPEGQAAAAAAGTAGQKTPDHGAPATGVSIE